MNKLNIAVARIRLLEQEKERLAAEKETAYRERNLLVAFMSKVFPSHLARHDDADETWDDEWRNIVYIQLPTGQVSWHIHDEELPNFAHLEVRENDWDGHTSEEKYARLAAAPQDRQVT